MQTQHSSPATFLQALPEPVTLGAGISWGAAKQWVLMAGPDILESESMLREVATELKALSQELSIPWVLKCSFDKANRQSLKSFRGLGVKKSLDILGKVKADFGVPLLTDLHDISQVEAVAAVADVIQIPAFLCRQTDLVVAAAKTGAVINIKKGQFMAPWDMPPIVEKAYSSGHRRVLLCERGVSFGYNRLVSDMTALVEMRKTTSCPVVMDATHSVQLPGGKGGSSDGRREMIAVLARAAMAVGVDGVFLECHPDPDKALCDGPNSLALKDMRALMMQLQSIWITLKASEQ